MNIYCIVFFFPITCANKLTKDITSLSNVSLALQPHSEGLTCTLYLRKTTPGDEHLWQKLIYDNKANSPLCLYTAQNETIPDPDIRFLEQCTINIIVGTDYPYNYIKASLHSVRSSHHSVFIIVRNEKCTYYPYFKTEITRPIIFYYFPSCEDITNSKFPNGFIDYLNSNGQIALLNYFRRRKFISVHSFEYKQSLFQHKDSLHIQVGDHESAWYAQNPDLIETYCNRFVVTLDSGNPRHYCTSGIRFWYNLGIFLNISFTRDNSLLPRSSGRALRNWYLGERSKYAYSIFISGTEIWDDYSVRFVYCVPKYQSLLLTTKALVSPFDCWTWISLLSSVILLIFVKMYPLKLVAKTEKLLFNLRMLLEQSTEAYNFCGVVVCVSFFVITAMYKMRVTSDLLVPTKVQPISNISFLFKKGYSLVYDYTTTENILQKLRTDSKLKISSWVYTNNTIQNDIFLGKSVRLYIFKTSGIQSQIQRIEAELVNMTCFTAETHLGVTWGSYSFIHPWFNRMKRFTKTLFEMGVFNMLEELGLNDFVLYTRSVREERSTAEFIKLGEAKPIFLITLSCLVAATAVFAVENRHWLVRTSRLVFATFKRKLKKRKHKGRAVPSSKHLGLYFEPTVY